MAYGLKLKLVSKIREEAYLIYLIHLIRQSVIPSYKHVLIVGDILQIHIELMGPFFRLAV